MLIARLVTNCTLLCLGVCRGDLGAAAPVGARRRAAGREATACVHQLRDLLECAWPGVLEAAADLFDSTNWCGVGGGAAAL